MANPNIKKILDSHGKIQDIVDKKEAEIKKQIERDIRSLKDKHADDIIFLSPKITLEKPNSDFIVKNAEFNNGIFNIVIGDKKRHFLRKQYIFGKDEFSKEL